MKINKIEIEGFKGIGELAVKPKNFNVIIGKNNTSKSSLLEAIDYAILLNGGLSFNLLRLLGPVSRRMKEPILSHIINVKKKESNITIKLENDTKKIRFYRLEEVEAIKEYKKEIIEDFESFLKENNKADENKKKNNPKLKDELDELGKLIDKIFSNDKQVSDIIKGGIFLEKQDGTEFLNSYRNSYLRRPQYMKPIDKWVIRKGYGSFDTHISKRAHKQLYYSLAGVPISFIETSDPTEFESFIETDSVHSEELPVQKIDEIQT